MNKKHHIANLKKESPPADEQLLHYLQGNLPPEEQHQWEMLMDKDAMMKDAAEGLSEINIPGTDVQAIKSQLDQQLWKKIKEKKTKRHPNRNKDMAHLWIYILIVLLLVVLSYVVIHFSVKQN